MQVTFPNEREMEIATTGDGVVLNIYHSENGDTYVGVNTYGELNHLIYKPDPVGNEKLWTEIGIIEKQGVWTLPASGDRQVVINFPRDYIPVVVGKLKEFASSRRMF